MPPLTAQPPSRTPKYLLPRVLSTSPARLGLDFDLSEVSSGIYGFLLVLIMLLRPEGLLPEGRRG
jgi:branched-chain amino acid transport system permease protein